MGKGRKEGSKNLEYNSKGNVKNQHGIWFTKEEKKRLESLVNSVNRKAKKLQESEFGMYLAGDNNISVGDYYKTAKYKHSDMIFNTKSKSLNRFTSKKEYNHYIKALEQMTQRNYVSAMVWEYKKRYIKGIEQNLILDNNTDKMNQVINKIKSMKWQDYMKLVQTNPDASITYIYDPKDINSKANRIYNIVFPPAKNNKKKPKRGK
jgi:hypothetical protein